MGGSHLLYSRRFVGVPVIEPGRGLAYLSLFSEIGLILLVTTLFGALAGHWVDEQIGTLPILTLAGFLLGAAGGTVVIYRLLMRFLARLD